MKTKTDIYLESTQELNEILNATHRRIADSELHRLILQAEPALREQIACLERLSEELFFKRYRDPQPPVTAFPPNLLTAAKAARLYKAQPFINPNDLPKVFHLVNNSLVELVLLNNEKKNILWANPDGAGDQP